MIVCVHNGSRFLREALCSVLDQTDRDFEVIVVDDGSSDSSVAIAESLADSRIRILRQDNRGAAAAMAGPVIRR